MAFLLLVISACSTTSSLPEQEKLYVGIDKITYADYEKNDHFVATQEEVEAALSCPPNGALFGSSKYKSPFPIGLYLWNAFSNSDSKFSKWITKSFASKPILMSTVSPELRASVAQSTLVSHGYFRGTVESSEVDTKNEKKQKIGYKVTPGHLFTIDSIEYRNFPPEAMLLIDSTKQESLLHKNDPFDVSALDGERNRVANLLRNNGYFYFHPSYSSYLADTINVPGKVWVRLQMADSIPEIALHKWYIGKRDIFLKKTFMEQVPDTITRRNLTVHFNGKKPPLRTRVILRDLKLRSRRLFSYSDYEESVNKLTSNDIFSMVDFKFTPRDTTLYCDTLDLTLNCVFDKPYDSYIETNLRGKTTGFLGPQLVLGFSKKNAFKGGEVVDVNLHGSYEWQLDRDYKEPGTNVNSYEYGLDASITLPRLLLPFQLARRRWYTQPSTLIKASSNTVNRSGYFKRRIVSGEFTYLFQPKPNWRHKYSPLIVEYNYLKSGTERFYEMMEENPYLFITMQDVFIPKMKYTLSWSSPKTYRNPLYWETSISEAGNLVSLGYMIAGNKWTEKQKEMFKNPYAQFLKLETELTKTWTLNDGMQLVGHLNGGVLFSYGNSDYAPYTEQFYVGGANSIRAFSVRSLGPGRYRSMEKRWRYVEETGDVKFQANLEWRMRIWGSLNGAVFLDTGNVWLLNEEDYRKDSKFQMKNFLDQMAVGTGLGLRYDLDYFVIRLDWGFGLHVPYKTDHSGWFNIPSFKEGNSLHFAIGYPF